MFVRRRVLNLIVKMRKKPNIELGFLGMICAVLNKVDTFHPPKLESVMKSTTKRTQRDYSLAFKLTVVDEVEKGSLTYKQAQ
ncbi:hypothetical protein, partial [Vibrio alginolyticus]|uniref:hypothetical protein n=1 Tax=Vibrio alginolyticus TaxID=663 RepID=UPI003D7CF086